MFRFRKCFIKILRFASSFERDLLAFTIKQIERKWHQKTFLLYIVFGRTLSMSSSCIALQVEQMDEFFEPDGRIQLMFYYQEFDVNPAPGMNA